MTPSTNNAILNPGGNEEIFTFTAPSLIVNHETHQVIQAGIQSGDGSDAEDQLRLLLADSTRELCRRTLEDPALELDFDFRVDLNNCEDYSPATIEFVPTIVADGDFAESGPTVELNPACFGTCLLDECNFNETGDHDPAPALPFLRTVSCQCEIERIANCMDLEEVDARLPVSSGFTESFCVPEGKLPADFCRTDVADYMNASIRVINHYVVIPAPPATFDGTCGDFSPEDLSLVVRCLAQDEQGSDIVNEAAEAYTEQDDACAPGCSDLACDDLQNQSVPEEPGAWPCSQVFAGICPPDCLFDLDTACDCDLLPEDCFENEIVAGVCLPDPVGGGADGGSDTGGGDPDRLRSAITLLAGVWDVAANFECSELEPGGFYIPNEGNPPPSSAVSPYALTNGTTFATGLHHTCPAPTTDDVQISTYDTTLEELCRLIPLCAGSSELGLTITASESSSTLASGTLTKDGDTITITDDGAPLSVGEHTLDLCVEHDATEVVACSAQSIRAAAPLGSGVDGYGYFAGELALDFIPIASKPGASPLSLSDDGYVRVSLPSGFDFPFYGTTVYGYLWVGANGGINTTAGTVAASNTGLPAASYANAPDIAVYWDDLDPSSGGGVYTWFDGTRFIVSWEGVSHGRDGSSSTSNGVSVQAHIYASGRIELHYLDTNVGYGDYDLGKSATIGVGNLAGTQAVEVSYDSNALLTAGVAAVGFARDSDGCLADGLIIPPEVACTANDHYLTVCTPTGDTITLPLPDVSECAYDAVGVAGEVFESGSKESTLQPLSAPIPIDASGDVELDEGAHRIRWWPVDGEDEHVGPAFTQIVLVGTWVHADCNSSSQSMMVLSEDDDTYIATSQITSLALVGLSGEDVLATSAGDDFIGDGPGAGICEANEGNDELVGEDGDDTLDCGPGDDRAWGGSGADLLVGGADADMLDGQDGDDILQGDGDDDELWGGLGDDVLEGGDGADTLLPGSGIDAVYGGAGDDVIVILDACELTSGKLLSGGDGADTLLLPPGLDLVAVVAAGVIVAADIESVVTSTELPTHRAACEPS